MLKKLAGEAWKPLTFQGWKKLRNRYAISSLGRIVSYREDIFKEGKILKGSLTTGYRTLNLHRPGNKGTLYLHREMGKLFLEKKSVSRKYVIHLNYDKLDNRVKNLRWATLEEMIDHQQNSPAKISYKQKQANRTEGLKLSAAKVRKIKNILNSKKRTVTIRQLAMNYGVSEMTIYRIKSGENWGRIK